MSLVTRCPKCQRAFQVVLDQLRLHDGLVRCGSCSHIFDGYACLQTQLPTLTRLADDNVVEAPAQDVVPPVQQAPQVSSAPRSPVASAAFREPARHCPEPEFEPAFDTDETEPAVMRYRPISADKPDEPVLSVLGEARLRGAEPSAVGRTQPEFMATPGESSGSFSRLLWGTGCVVALVVLALQIIYVYRNEIATIVPNLRPSLTAMCAGVGCEVNYVRHLERISIDASSLQQVGGTAPEGQPTELTLRLSMRNRFDKSQPWPHLLLELKDASGTVVVRKVIAPHQYLPSTLLDQPFAPGQEVDLMLPVSVTGLKINGFQLDKFFP